MIKTRFTKSKICKCCKGNFTPVQNWGQIYCDKCRETEIRTCICGCNSAFKCMHFEKQQIKHGHNSRKKEEDRVYPLKPKTLSNILCACGCKQFTYLNRYTKKPAKFVKGHDKRGKKILQTTLNAIIKANTGNHYHLGKKHTEETIQKLRLSGINYGFQKGNIPTTKGKKYPGSGWSNGLTKETDERIKKQSIKMVGKLLGEKHPNWQGGKSFEIYPQEFNNSLREEIREGWGRICQYPGCGKTEKACGRKLTVHHIDYNKKNCNKDNLIPLCVGHNSKVNKNKKHWKKYFIKLINSKNTSMEVN